MMNVHSLSYGPTSGSAGNDSGPLGKRRVLIFMIPGNPGLIDYYATFLQALRKSLDASSAATKGTDFHIYGQNLAGFSDDEHEPFTTERKPFDLEYQIQYTLEGLHKQCVDGEPYDSILLIGHSVGSYIALEVWRRVLLDSQLSSNMRLTAGILLFPTIEHIAQSPNGWKLNALRQTPLIGPNAYRIATGFLRLCSHGALRWFVSSALGMPGPAADVTAKWLKSRDGVWQALHLGMDEMRVIGEDKWDDELWAIEQEADKLQALSSPPSPTARPRFYLFFGRRDHWVADHYRDEFIRKRAKQTRILVDEGNLPHAFVIDRSDEVAEKVHDWIREIYDCPSDNPEAP